MSRGASADIELPPFVPRRGLSNGHVMTIFAWGTSRAYLGLPEPAARIFQTTPDTQVLAHCYWQREAQTCPTLIALHGLEGSSSGHYMRGLAHQAWRRNWNAVLLNQRNCGGTEHLTPTLYHSGLTADAVAVIAELNREGFPHFGLVGYSLGGNVALRLVGELAVDPPRAALPIRAVAAVSPTIDLQTCVEAIERPINTIYQWNFMRGLRSRLQRKAALWPGQFNMNALAHVRTIRQFDDAYTAPLSGFGDAKNYYYTASSMRLIDKVRIPTLIVSAEDDPFVPAEQFQRAEVAGNPNVRVMLSPSGGHCGFVSASGYWAEETAVRFIAAFMPS